MKIRKDERKYMEDVLSTEGDLDEVVGAAFATAADLLLAREWYVLLLSDGYMTYLYGPYESEAVARKDQKKFVAAGPGTTTAQIRKMYRLNERLL